MKSLAIAKLSTLFTPESIESAQWHAEQRDDLFCLYLLLYSALERGHTALHRNLSELFPTFADLFPELSQDVAHYLQFQAASVQPESMGQTQRNLAWRATYCAFQEVEEVEKAILAELKRIVPDEMVVNNVPSGLNLEQVNAIECFFKYPISIITGGPGTGKTYTAGKLVEQYIQVATARGVKPKVLLSATTGKAVRQLEKSVSRYVTAGSFESRTLHGLISQFSTSDGAPLFFDAHLIIVDEASMIDLKRCVQLLERLASRGTRLLLLGDHWQLPPVGFGSPFEDLCLLGAQFGCGIAELKSCVRAESPELLTIAKAVREGDMSTLESLSIIEPLRRDNIVRKFSKCVDAPLIITPSRYGPYGVQALNETLGPLFSTRRLMVTENDWNIEIANGEIGEVLYKESYGRKRPFLNLQGRHIPLSLIKAYEEAFAITIHKSQGSEGEEVFCILPECEQPLTRKLVYTAVTRAKKKITIFSDRAILAKALSNNFQTVSVSKHAKLHAKLLGDFL